MKNHTIISFLLLTFLSPLFPLVAQTETLLGGDGQWSVSGFGGPTMAISQINGQNALWLGGQGGAIFNERFILGGGSYQLVQDAQVLESEAHMNQSGFMLGYVFRPQRKVHLTATLMAGGGAISQDNGTNDAFRFINPQLEVESNVTHYFRIGLGVGQQFIQGVESPLFPSDEALSRPYLAINLRFGAF